MRSNNIKFNLFMKIISVSTCELDLYASGRNLLSFKLSHYVTTIIPSVLCTSVIIVLYNLHILRCVDIFSFCSSIINTSIITYNHSISCRIKTFVFSPKLN